MVLAATVREAGRRFGDLTALRRPRRLDRLVPRTRPAAPTPSPPCSPAGAWARATGWSLRVPSDSGYVVAYAAAAKLGAITAGVNPRLAPPEQEALVALADPRSSLSEPGEVASLVAEGAALVSSAGRRRSLPDDPDRPVAIVFTSGTTGLPKGAVFCERQLEAVAVADTGGAWAPRRVRPGRRCWRRPSSPTSAS